jgi:C-terminal processing protease CtpA/Prc
MKKRSLLIAALLTSLLSPVTLLAQGGGGGGGGGGSSGGSGGGNSGSGSSGAGASGSGSASGNSSGPAAGNTSGSNTNGNDASPSGTSSSNNQAFGTTDNNRQSNPVLGDRPGDAGARASDSARDTNSASQRLQSDSTRATRERDQSSNKIDRDRQQSLDGRDRALRDSSNQSQAGSSNRNEKQAGTRRSSPPGSETRSSHRDRSNGESLANVDLQDPIGVEFQTNDRDLLVVLNVKQRGIAWQSGMLPGDQIISVDGNQLNSRAQLNRWLAKRAGANVAMDVLRNGERQTIQLTSPYVAAYRGDSSVGRSDQQAEVAETDRRPSDGQGSLGVQFDGRYGDAPVVLKVYRDSPAARAGVRPGDEILMINRARVRSADDVIRAMSSLEPGKAVHIQVMPTKAIDLVLQLDGTAADQERVGRREDANELGDPGEAETR